MRSSFVLALVVAPASVAACEQSSVPRVEPATSTAAAAKEEPLPSATTPTEPTASTSASRDASAPSPGSPPPPSADEPGKPVDLAEFIRRWNALMASDPGRDEYKLTAPKGASPYELPVGKLWCSVKLVTSGPSRTIQRATLEHEAKASGKWNCGFAEAAMLEALTDDRALAQSILKRVDLAENLRKGSRDTTEDNLKVTRHTEEGNGDVVVVIAPKR